MIKKLILLMTMLALAGNLYAHGGRTNVEGCHNNAKTADYHCHGKKKSTPKTEKRRKKQSITIVRQLSEDDANDQWCDRIGGRREVRHEYTTKAGERGYISVDCETATHVYEGGLDKRSSLDSIQQAVFFAELTGKKPAVVIYSLDGKEGKIEYRIRKAAEALGVEYVWVEFSI